MQDEVEHLFVGELGSVGRADELRDLARADGRLWVLAAQRRVELGVLGLEGGARLEPLEQVADVAHEARVGKGRLVDRHAHAALDDARDAVEELLFSAFGSRGPRARGDGGVGDGERYAGCFLPLDARLERFLHAGDGHLAQAELDGVRALDLSPQRHGQDHVLAGPLERELDVVGERDGQVGGELVGELLGGEARELRRELKYLGVNLFNKGQVLGVDAVECALHLFERDLVRHLAEADSLAGGDELAPRSVEAYGRVVVDALDCLHVRPFVVVPRVSSVSHAARAAAGKAVSGG